MLVTAGAQVGADRQRGARARADRRADAAAAATSWRSNLWWSWDNETTSLFRELDPAGGGRCGHNPVALLAAHSRRHARRAGAGSSSLHSRINYAYRRMQEYLNAEHTWGARHAGVLWARPVAYFSAEFGLHESLPIYSGGLGVLAGDHLKSASDLGIPLVGVGLYYDQGYFRQRLDRDGWQHEDYLDVDSRVLPIEPAVARRRAGHRLDRDAHRHDRGARLEAGRRPQHAAAARLERRRQRPEDRELTARLYGGDDRVRIRQELLLGVGGVRALAALGISPGVVHLNEGHSAFAALELVRQRMERRRHRRVGKRCGASRRRSSSPPTRRCRPGTIAFPPRSIEEHLGPLARRRSGSTHDASWGSAASQPGRRRTSRSA